MPSRPVRQGPIPAEVREELGDYRAPLGPGAIWAIAILLGLFAVAVRRLVAARRSG